MANKPALPLIRTWACPRCRFTNTQRATDDNVGPCPNDGAVLRRGRPRRGLLGPARLAQDLIDGRARLYEELHDPFRAWEAYWLAWNAQGTGVEMPAWVTDYLARVARRMTALSIALSERSKPPGSLAQALELDGHGGGAVAARRATLQRHQQYVVDVIEIMAKGYTQSKAVDALLDVLHSKDRGKDRRTIERAIGKYKRKGWRAAGGRGGGLPPLPSEASRQVKAP